MDMVKSLTHAGRLFVIAAAFLLLSCASAGSQASAANNNVAEAQASKVAMRIELSQQLKAELAENEQHIHQALQELPEVKVSSLSGPCKNEKAFDASTVRKSYNRIRNESLAAFGARAETAEARAAAEREFPALPAPSTSECYGSAPIYTPSAISGLQSQLTAWARDSEKFSLLIDVTVRSSPQAIVQLRPVAATNVFGPAWTAFTFPSMFRGNYQLSVSADGYKPFETKFNLSDYDAPRIRCVLVENSKAGLSKCALE
ncbi:carboxypeptidase regulatory-like domain-containing protein [Corallococcus sp. AB049A]|nr:carboxypeptidase regulatory-like domain-containing protein [Corallococcus sp. AB049A]